jgi:hypothetical protein
MPLLIVADTPQEVLGRVADWLDEYTQTVAMVRNLTPTDTMQLLAMVLRAGTVVPSSHFNPTQHLYVEAPKPKWNRRLPVVKKP